MGSKRRIFAAIVRISRSSSSKLDAFGTNGKRICDCLLVRHSNLALLLRYSDLLAENCGVFPTLSHSVSLLPMFLLEFRGEVNHEENRIMGLFCGESCMILTLTVFD